LEAANRELETFTYSVSHDLRAPLRHISGFARILSEDRRQPACRCSNHIRRIPKRDAAHGLLVDDLLNLARLGRQPMSVRISGLNSIVEDVITELAPQSAERQIEWKIGNLPFLECDPGLIKQLMQNLLANALKFTRPRR